ncbi:MAG: hypothetical protein GC190_06190 [Alphaproteobacteria bacterium]|nr:hypothetical protein [Alphaproteobacteria bacterium]
MRTIVLSGVFLAAVLSPARAADVTLLFKKYKCTQCHAADHRSGTAPSYDKIMKKYEGQADAPAHLASVIKNGGGDVWGFVRMPANPSVPDADVQAMVDWILKH